MKIEGMRVWAAVGLAGLVVFVAGNQSAEAFTPYRLLIGAVKSPLNAGAFIQDKRLKSALRRSLVVADPDATLSVSPYVFGGHGYIVGWVDDLDERSRLEDAAQGVEGLRSLDVYLPIKPTGDEAPSSVDELGLKTKVVASIVAVLGTDQTNVSVDVLGKHVVVLGVLDSADQVHRVTQAAAGTSGVSGVTSYLSVPPPSERKILGSRLP